MMKQAVLVTYGRHQSEWAGAFAEGLKKHGWQANVRDKPAACDLLVLWGVRRQDEIRRQRQRGEVCILERGYLGDRFKWSSVSFGGGLNGRGIFRGPLHDPSRWEKHFSGRLKPWKGLTGGYALVLGQVAGDMSVKGISLEAFYRAAKRAFSDVGFDTRFRPHPKSHEMKSGSVQASLQKAFSGAAVAISWNSNANVDAVLAGVPSVTMDRGAMAWEVSGHELKFPKMPDREAWAHALAWKQWTLEEMKSGYCWDAVREIKAPCEQAA